MKKFAKIGLIVLMLAMLIVAVTACNNGNGQEQLTISISEDNMPQTVFVKGNDLDLSSGKLIAVKGNEQNEIALDADGVAVTGYDKNSLGEQTLTITYGGASTTLLITVVERMIVTNYVTEYVVGEPFDNSGRLQITKDNGKSLNLYIRDDEVSVSEFDSSTAGSKTIKLSYNDGELECECSLAITVYAADQVSFNAPLKKIYNSHEESIDSNGGYFTVTAKSGTIVRSFPLEDDMISGYNPSVVSESNPTVQQVITVAYPGKDFTFNVSIKLSDVTRIKNAASELSAALDWSGNSICSVSEAQGELAMRAYKLLYNLTEEDFEYITEQEMIDIARPVSVYGSAQWSPKAEQYSALFNVNSNYLSLNCETHDDTETQFNAISNLLDDDILFEFGDLLVDVVAVFGNDILYGTTTIGSYLSNVCAASDIKDAIAKIELMLEMHDALKDIPSEWTVDSLAGYSEQIEKAKAVAVELGEMMDDPIFGHSVFNTVSEWRPDEKNDYFEILYRYYYALYKSENETVSNTGVAAIGDLISLCLPGILENYYMLYIRTYMEEYYIAGAYNLDTVGFVMAYRNLIATMENIIASEDEMIIDLFNNYEMISLVIALQTDEYGLFSILGAAYGDVNFENVWTKYIDAITAFFTVDDDSDASKVEEVQNTIKEFYKSFIELTPELQAQFLASINSYGSVELFPLGDIDTTMFINMFYLHYATVFGEDFKNLIIQDDDNSGIVLELLDALQFYMFRNELADDEGATYLDYFLDTMKTVKEMYGALSNDEKAVFDEHIGFFYEKFVGIYELYDSEGNFIEDDSVQDSEWMDDIDDLISWYQLYYAMYLSANYMQNYALNPAVISAYETIVDLYNKIMQEAPQEIKDMLLYRNYDVFDDGQAETLETYLYLFRSLHISLLSSYPVDSQYAIMVWNEYQSSNIREYMSSLIDFYAAAVVDNDELTVEMVKNAMSGFCALTDNEKLLFITMDGDGEFIYYYALRTFFETAFAESSDAIALANGLLDIEIDWVFNLTDEQFVARWESLADKYEALSADDKELFDETLLEVYNYYKNVYEEIIGEQDNQ